MAGFTVTFHGASGHAGTVPMRERSDAFAACAELATRLRERALEIPGAVATIGDVTVAGAAANVIPGLVHATVDVRAPTAESLDLLVAAVPAVAAEVAVSNRCGVDAVRGWRSEPVAALGPRPPSGPGRRPRSGRPNRRDHVGGRPRRRHLGRGRGRRGDALRAQPERWSEPSPDELSDEADVAAAIAVLTETLGSLL